ncbi:MAG TPA: S41 family peptidase [Bryobacteraceae bacterium]|nr:S41 family peptidase [Bryobacteraceae bacterium]
MLPLRLVSLFFALGVAAGSGDQRKLNIESFEFIWTTIRDQYWDPTFGGLNWQAVHDELRPRMDKASTMPEARHVMREMIDRLGKSHFGIIPSDVYGDLDEREEGGGPAVTGIDVRVLEGKAIVTAVEDGSSAEAQDVRRGWEVVSVDGVPIAPALRRIAELDRDSTMLELHLARSVQAKLSGATGSHAHVEFVDGEGRHVTKQIERSEPPGALARFGYLPPMHVWFQSRKIAGNIGYLTFNLFLDPAHLMPEFGDALKSCAECAGVIIDLRGNPGGLGIMATGMAGWFLDRPDQRLGTMHMRQAPIKFTVNPRLPTYRGAVAMLVDGCSASTSEIFAEGMKDLGRARVFGTRTAGAALPSAIDKLPNGDGFQHAVADYMSEGGKPLEGVGVIPDVEVKLTREALLAGRDPVLEAAIEWMHTRK